MAPSGQNDRVAKRYARALFDALEPTNFDSATDQLAQLSKAWNTVDVFRESNLNPQVNDSKKLAILDDVANALGGWSSDQLKNLLHLIVSRGRAVIIPKVSEFFEALVREFRKNLSLSITSAKELSIVEISAMKSKLSTALGGEVSLEVKTDATLIAGVTVRLGDRYLDRSVAGTLNRLASQLS